MPSNLPFKTGERILFQGDSITDATRQRDDFASLGDGWVMLLKAWMDARYPDLQLEFLNRGIGGNRAVDLEQRWQKDCLDLKPDWLSILIGINDTWRRYDSNDPTSTESFARSYENLLRQVREQTGAKIILCEPFLTHTPEDRLTWREDLDPKIGLVTELAEKYGAIYVPLDKVFAQAVKSRPADHWAGDGVHPSRAGQALIAQAWLNALQGKTF
jgi:lysophospholipase L1-like esterase